MRQTIHLKVSGFVEKIVSIEPRMVRLTGKTTEEIKEVINVVPMEKYPFSIKELVVQNKKTIEATFRPMPDEEGGWQIEVVNKQNHAGRYFNMITLKTDSDSQPQMKINVFGNVLN